jgi:uncharacterized protein YegJ (DUF2314 family)
LDKHIKNIPRVVGGFYMKRAFRYLVILIVLVSFILVGCGINSSDDGIVNVAADDSEMNEAISAAQQSLNHFWSIYDNPKSGEEEFALKVKIEDKLGNVEHFWTVDIKKEDGKILGVIDNDPVYVKTVEYGQEIEIPEKDISDWTYIKDNKTYGGFTIRVLLDRIPKQEAEQIRSRLSEKPF